MLKVKQPNTVTGREITCFQVDPIVLGPHVRPCGRQQKENDQTFMSLCSQLLSLSSLGAAVTYRPGAVGAVGLGGVSLLCLAGRGGMGGGIASGAAASAVATTDAAGA